MVVFWYQLKQKKSKLQSLGGWRLGMILGWGLTLAFGIRVESAEKIYLDYGPLQFSLSVHSLEKFATSKVIDSEFATYASHLSPEQLDRLYLLLSTKTPLTPVAVSQFFYSPQGSIILQRLGEIIQTKARQSGFYALRSALILSSADPQGLTGINVVKKFPTKGILINSDRAFELLEELNQLIKDTDQVTDLITEQFNREKNTFPKINSKDLSNLQVDQPLSVQKITLSMRDFRRHRVFPVDLYLPQNVPGKLPLIIISHGLGSNRETFTYLATHLASYGFAIAIPEHPESNAKQLQNLAVGLSQDITPYQELINRPLDITYTLNELQRQYFDRIDTTSVGFIGQSLGGYTGLLLAGGNINLPKLQQDCNEQTDREILNLSLLLQCSALNLPASRSYHFRDSRISSVIVINPLSSRILGQEELSKINIPLMMVGGSSDSVTPLVEEQYYPFRWISSPQKYFVLLQKGTHFSTLSSSSEDIVLPASVVGADPQIAQGYMKVLSVAFFKVYLTGNKAFLPYLSASYSQYISQNEMPLKLVKFSNEP